jgi:hypothetical protein
MMQVINFPHKFFTGVSIKFAMPHFEFRDAGHQCGVRVSVSEFFDGFL